MNESVKHLLAGASLSNAFMQIAIFSKDARAEDVQELADTITEIIEQRTQGVNAQRGDAAVKRRRG